MLDDGRGRLAIPPFRTMLITSHEAARLLAEPIKSESVTWREIPSHPDSSDRRRGEGVDQTNVNPKIPQMQQ